MNRRDLLAVPALVALTLLHPAYGQPPGLSPQEQDAYEGVIAWFRALYRPLAELGELIDRKRLISYLASLGKTFEGMLDDKREIALLLDEDPIHRDELKAVADRLAANVRLSRQRLTRVSFLLKQQLRDQGRQVAEELSDALLSRKAWLRQLEDRVEFASPQQLKRYRADALGSAAALAYANAELARLVVFLSSDT